MDRNFKNKKEAEKKRISSSLKLFCTRFLKICILNMFHEKLFKSIKLVSILACKPFMKIIKFLMKNIFKNLS